MTRSAKNPITTLGTLASVSMIGLRNRRARGEAYSDRYRAAPSPSGAATIMAMPATINVPATIVFTSKRFLRGNQPSDHSVDSWTLDRKSAAPPARLATIATLIDDRAEGGAEEQSPHPAFTAETRRVAPQRLRRMRPSIAACAMV